MGIFNAAKMLRISLLALSCAVLACGNYLTGTGPTMPPGTYVLQSVEGLGLPVTITGIHRQVYFDTLVVVDTTSYALVADTMFLYSHTWSHSSVGVPSGAYSSGVSMLQPDGHGVCLTDESDAICFGMATIASGILTVIWDNLHDFGMSAYYWHDFISHGTTSQSVGSTFTYVYRKL